MFFYPIFEYNGKKYQQNISNGTRGNPCKGCAFDQPTGQSEACLDLAYNESLPNDGCGGNANLHYKEVISE